MRTCTDVRHCALSRGWVRGRDMVLAIFEINMREKVIRKAHCIANRGNQWAKTGISGDTSQNGLWDNLRNVLHNGHPMDLVVDAPSKASWWLSGEGREGGGA